ncbi:sepiapterin reductase-like isoform X2 [Portunus trituberculatus]|nr:sepiapterin reductase-like isoform X2 [Portunus trituberculatus]XP_045138977.1 sepiapterin reductase-like isoform X2 [Portunus trituberculatus]XP_045138984.1 sepiapterin reductase-like isoform X2 [Portunus trituberculatus]
MSDSGSAPWWVVVTGASQGFGAAICTELAPLLPPGSRMLGLARSQQGLATTAAAVTKANPAVTFSPVVMDLATAKAVDYEAALEDNLGTSQSSPPGQALLFQNAGSLGSLKYLREMDDAAHLSAYFNLNISSVILLNAAFMRLISAVSGKVKVKIINISSICALEPFKSWGLYCTSKAGRDMLFRVLAAEDPGVRVLNYSPGPLDTGMQVHARTETQDDDIRKAFTSMKEEGKLLSCQTSVRKLLQVLEKDEFKSGGHVDFFEV